jgi:hypothetical protein
MFTFKSIPCKFQQSIPKNGARHYRVSTREKVYSIRMVRKCSHYFPDQKCAVLYVYGVMYLYHDTHFHPSNFFLLLYVSADSYSVHVSWQILILTYLHTSSCRQLPTYTLFYRLYCFILGSSVYMISSCSPDVIISS